MHDTFGEKRHGVKTTRVQGEVTCTSYVIFSSSLFIKLVAHCPLTSFLSTYCNCTAYWGGHPLAWWALMGQCTLNWRLPRILGCFWCSCRARLGLLAVKSFRTWPAWEGRRVSEVLSWLVRKPGWCQGEEWCLCQESWTAEGLFGKSTVGQVIRSYPLMRRWDSFFGWLRPGGNFSKMRLWTMLTH